MYGYTLKIRKMVPRVRVAQCTKCCDFFHQERTRNLNIKHSDWQPGTSQSMDAEASRQWAEDSNLTLTSKPGTPRADETRSTSHGLIRPP